MRGGYSAVSYKSVIGHVVSYRMGERNASAIIYGCGIDAVTLKLVKECLVVVGTHTGPTSVLHLGIEKGYCRFASLQPAPKQLLGCLLPYSKDSLEQDRSSLDYDWGDFGARIG